MILDLASVITNLPVNQALKDRLINGFCYSRGYQDVSYDRSGAPVSNPEAKPDFFNRLLSDYITATAQGYETSQEIEKAKVAAIARFASEVEVTIDQALSPITLNQVGTS